MGESLLLVGTAFRLPLRLQLRVKIGWSLIICQNSFTFHKFVRKAEVSHIGATRWAIHGKEAHTCGRYVIRFAVAVDKQLVTFLCSSIEAYRIINTVIHTESHFFSPPYTLLLDAYAKYSARLCLQH